MLPILLSAVIALWPCQRSGAQDTVEKKKVATRGVVFHVKGKSGGELWLAGSVHVLRPKDLPLPAVYEDAYAKVQQLVFEIPPSSIETPEAMAMIQKNALYLDGSKLKDHLSPAGYRKLTEYSKKASLPLEQLQLMKPWMLAQMIVMQEFTKQGFKPELGIDAFFETKAAKDGKTVQGLETPEFQIGLFANLPAPQQEQMLTSTLDDLADAEEFIDRLVGAWKEGKPEKVSSIMNEAMEGDPELGKAVLYDRNKDWIAPIEKYLNSGTPTMVIVGAGHLCGKDSVVELLQSHGHTVVQQ